MPFLIQNAVSKWDHYENVKGKIHEILKRAEYETNKPETPGGKDAVSKDLASKQVQNPIKSHSIVLLSLNFMKSVLYIPYSVIAGFITRVTRN